ncbi:probable E3 ubiquitin-protein ligase RNF217 [Carcharodon carcharias]|uniref:probable E3 ubiquitin-protein ligase RNF217 n=1 Tax=Carcharodon carcharias TaxID=13397 RepID=UPI001B7E8525|nr:probable E3 ubiquitin-protein ligase RNF217 [Carcharodon carcharias]
MWQEVRSLALFSPAEQGLYEEQILRRVENDTDSFKKCPKCSLLVQRLDVEDFSTKCPACPENRGNPYWFCWSCMRRWRGRSLHGAGCKRKSCKMVALLLSCPLITDPLLSVNGCPVVRACPQCKALISHTGGCKYVNCRNCANRFCYRCLEKYTVCYNAKPSCYHEASCAKPMVPRQTFTSE